MDNVTREENPRKSRIREIYGSLFAFFGYILLWLALKVAAYGVGAVIYLSRYREETARMSFSEIGEMLQRLLSAHAGMLSLIANGAFVVIALIIMAARRKNPVRETGLGRARPLPCLLAIPLGASLSFLIGTALSFVPWPTVSFRESVPAAPEILDGTAIMILSVAVVTPIAEELLFRGIGVSKIRKTLGAVPAVLIASILFAAAHGEPGAACGALVFGLFLGPLFLKYGLIPCVLCHAAFNLTAYFAEGRVFDPTLVLGIALSCAAAAIGSLYLTFKRKG
ncbi:MAG: CPBP family intramembrane metalloprotease [Clostridia bacterium]|nr:CPBP family intramembrane metalloprotease [Clostridia bacterium]